MFENSKQQSLSFIWVQFNITAAAKMKAQLVSFTLKVHIILAVLLKSAFEGGWIKYFLKYGDGTHSCYNFTVFWCISCFYFLFLFSFDTLHILLCINCDMQINVPCSWSCFVSKNFAILPIFQEVSYIGCCTGLNFEENF